MVPARPSRKSVSAHFNAVLVQIDDSNPAIAGTQLEGTLFYTLL
jgi:hypothetical protein